ncbi:MAG: hypothetical protein PHG04_00305 [Candidatus Nanoarchaeia archaeon]|nr:hypothetical protein [Candidatus Nanoarchaeia archaeon]MDD5053806.1 hypothetical protein [Candidatus Nanoarchaeia archaeon]
MKKAQSSILGVVLFLGIVLALVTATYVWAEALISKNVDKSNTDSVTEFMETLNNDILYVASTGARRVINANLATASLVINPPNNQIVIEISSAVPIINSVTQVPLNFIELATMKENFNINASLSEESLSIEGYESLSKYSNVSLEGQEYNATIFNNSATNEFDLLCLWNEALTYENDCATTNETISKEGISYEVIYVNESGDSATFTGDFIENPGIFSTEPAGIISAKGFRAGEKEYITFYLTYRTLTNQEGTDFKIFINCSNNCALSEEAKSLSISRNSVERGADYVNTYINIEVI